MTDIETFQNDSSIELIKSGIDTGSLLAVLNKRGPDIWKRNTWRQDEAGGQQDTEAVMFRWAFENNFASVRDSLSVKVEPALMETFDVSMPIFKECLFAIGAIEWGRTFVVKLKPNGRVYPHADVGIYADHYERFHLCLQADQEFSYYTQHPTGPVQRVNMRAGELYWFNHKRIHWAHNGGKNDRISIVIDAVSTKWKRKRDRLAIGVGYKYEGADNHA